MGNQLQKHKLWVAIASGFFILVTIIALIRYSQSGTEDLNQELDTPSLIQLAFERGEITEDERLLYLAYALFEQESLPPRFVGPYEWTGEQYIMELQEALTPERLCSMSPYMRSEFQRLLTPETLCTQNQASQQLSTPALIEVAFDRGEITNEQRLLYLAYALYEHESLPLRFVSYYEWFGEEAQYELEVLYDPEVFCSMSPYAQNEFQRVGGSNITCERSILFPVIAGALAIAIITLVFYVRKHKSQKLTS
jgi:hypothetical protein